jgi:hypothetical protein
MGTYHNAYDILSDVREGLNEYSTALVQGTATHGKFSNTFLMNKINRAQRLLYARLLKRIPGEFLTDAAASVSSGVITLPWDFGMVRRLEDENDLKVFPVDIDKRPVYGQEGSDRLYYRKGNTLVLTDLSVTETYHLWYWRKPRELDMGQAGAGANTLATSAKAIADYYNGMDLENITTGATAEITDYTAARVVTGPTLTASTDYYGIVSDLPEMFHQLIAPLAQIIAKAEHPISPEKPKKSEVELWKAEFEDVVSAFGHMEGDVEPEDVFTDFGGGGGGTVNIPGQGYPIRI